VAESLAEAITRAGGAVRLLRDAQARPTIFPVTPEFTNWRVGVSHDVGYVTNEQALVSLASVENAYAAPGTEVAVVWGEQPNSRKPAVEPHRQVTIRATVQPAPYSAFARENYRKN
jgi:hypothetical protein